MVRLLEKKVCLVTGASRGIGRGIAEHFAKEGAVVYANARKPGSIDEWCREVAFRYKTRAVPVYFDVTDQDLMKKAMAFICSEEGCLDVLVNNAGITKNELIGMIRQETLQELYETNVFAVIHALQYAARIMRRKRSGSIINLSSIIGVRGNRGETAYSRTKGAVISITKSAAKELAPYQIRVNAVAPGMTDTDMFMEAAKTKENVEQNLAQIGFGRLATPDDVAEACVFLASDRSSFITGQILGVDGGTIL